MSRVNSHSELSSVPTMRKGFTLTEIAIVLGIIGLILSAIWVAAASVYQNMHVAKAKRDLLQIVNATRTIFAAAGTTGDPDNTSETAALLAAGVFPSDDVTASGVVIAPWTNATFSVTSSTVTNSGDSFVVLIYNIPTSACIALATSTLMKGIGLAEIGTYTSNYTYGYFPLSTSQISQMCTYTPGVSYGPSNGLWWRLTISGDGGY